MRLRRWSSIISPGKRWINYESSMIIGVLWSSITVNRWENCPFTINYDHRWLKSTIIIIVDDHRWSSMINIIVYPYYRWSSMTQISTDWRPSAWNQISYYDHRWSSMIIDDCFFHEMFYYDDRYFIFSEFICRLLLCIPHPASKFNLIQSIK